MEEKEWEVEVCRLDRSWRRGRRWEERRVSSLVVRRERWAEWSLQSN